MSSTVGNRNYFTGKVTYFTKFIPRGQITMNIVTDPFPSDSDILYIEMYSQRQEVCEVGFRSP